MFVSSSVSDVYMLSLDGSLFAVKSGGGFVNRGVVVSEMLESTETGLKDESSVSSSSLISMIVTVFVIVEEGV